MTNERLEQAYGGALDNELAEGLDGEAARANVARRAAAYADNYGLDAREFRAFVELQPGVAAALMAQGGNK